MITLAEVSLIQLVVVDIVARECCFSFSSEQLLLYCNISWFFRMRQSEPVKEETWLSERGHRLSRLGVVSACEL